MSWLIVLLFTATVGNVAAAESAAPSPKVAAALSSPSRHEAAQPHYVAGWGPSIDSAALAKFSGGTSVTETITLNGTVANNSVDHVVTGANVISTGSFSGAMGLPMVIQNSGSGVLIQNATIINVQFQP
ncbi:MAG TPA: hypothetical protein VGV14_08325 [Rhodanobacter sp.]|nr:hypothetical protein [Rhodanobacter sp.]